MTYELVLVAVAIGFYIVGRVHGWVRAVRQTLGITKQRNKR